MADIDQWLANAARITKENYPPVDSDRILERVTLETTSALALARHDARLSMFCAAAAALLACASIDVVATRTWEQPRAAWLAAPPATSPFGLLVGK